MDPIRPDAVQPGQESVWGYPRPAIAELTTHHIAIELGSLVIADTRRAVRTLETRHPPSYYVPTADIRHYALTPARGSTFCEWKGHARYFDVVAGDECRERAVWSYPEPTRGFAILRDHVAFYPSAMDTCWVDGERVVSQPRRFHGGRITSAVAGPFKGGPGSRFW